MSNTTIQDVLLQLLCEIRDICDENNITYSLFDSTAAKALVLGETDEPFAKIMVRNDDFVKLCNIMEKKRIKHRSFDSMHNNPHYMDYSARYSNTETTNVSLAQRGNAFRCGIYVEIIPLRTEENSMLKHFKLRFFEHGWEKHFCRLTSLESCKYFLTTPFVNIMKIAGKKRVSRFIFDMIAKGHSGKINSNCSIKSFNQTLFDFPFDPLEKVKTVELWGEKFSISYKIDQVLRRVYARGWKQKAKNSTSGANNIVLLNVSCKQFERAMKKHGDIWKKYFRKKSKQMFIKAISSYYDRQKNSIWALAKRTGARARLYFYYMPKMGLIRNLVENKDYYRLSKIMQNNRIATLLAYKQGSGFAVNKELFDIQMMLFRFEGNEELANRIEANTPKYYMKPITDPQNK